MNQESKNKFAKKIGQTICFERMKTKMTQEEVAQALGIGTTAISRIERGIVIPSLSRLIDFAELFSCPIESFFGKSTGLKIDSLNSIASLLQNLSLNDRQFVLQLVESTTEHLIKQKNNKATFI